MTATPRLLGAASALALLDACSAHAAVLSATPPTVTAVAKSAQPGDTIQLRSGTYALHLWGISKRVVVMPAPGATVVVSEINASGSAFLTFRGLNVTMPAGAQYGVQVWSNAHDITLDGLTIKGPSCASLAGTGVHFRYLGRGSNVVLKNSTLTCLASGIGLSAVDGVTIDRNTLHDISTDGILGTGVSNSVVTNNTEYGFHVANDVHPDFIQFAKDQTDAPPVDSKNVTIANNLLYRGNGDLVQGIFVEDGDGWKVHDNVLYGTMYNGISFARSTNVALAHNYVQPIAYTGANPPPGRGEPDAGTWIILRQQLNGATLTGNAAPRVTIGATADGAAQPTNVTQTGTTITTAAAPGDQAQYNAWVNATGSRAGPSGLKR